ncbi:MAG TPA: S41 family peptidase [Blastocatellia bacterium]|nr:S41 family peptidase [Blastocatellia bacterium]
MTVKPRLFYTAVSAVILCISVSIAAAAQTKLLRYPDLYGDKVVFTYGGDLWTAQASGGTATRLTAHPGVELFAKFSPDGRWIAFTGQYDGDEQVYVIPATGGEPRQLTFYPARGPLPARWGSDNQVYGWTNDGKAVVFRSLRDSWTLPVSNLYTVPVTGGPVTRLPMPESGAGDYSPDGSKLVYSPRSRDFRTEKRYGGGQANDLFIYDLKTNDAKRITDNPRSDRDPMWIGNTIYFNSDRDRHFNLYAYDVAKGTTTAVTNNQTWDVRWPSSEGNKEGSRIVYELNGELQIFDPRSKKTAPIAITVPDDALNRRPSRISVSNLIFGYSLSPKGERALFEARGEIFTSPIEKGTPRNLTNSPGFREKWPRWSPDGSRIAFISDRTGEEEVWVIDQDGSKPAEQLTNGGRAMRYAPEWSPDSKTLAFSDKDGRVWVLTVADKKLAEIAHSTRSSVQDYAWSPDSNYLAFSMTDENAQSSIYIWSARENRLHRATGLAFSEADPAWDPQGEYLYYRSIREFAPQISNVEFTYAANKNDGIFALALRKNVKHPFPPESDEVTITRKSEKEEEPKKSGEEKLADLAIEFDGLESRAARVPLGPNNYNGLSAKTGHLIYLVTPAFYYGRQADPPASLRIYSLKDRKETTLIDDISGYALSSDGSKLLVRNNAGFTLLEATSQADKPKKSVSTANLQADRVPTEEWAQIFGEVWRRYRDFFYVPNMHGYDWEALRKQYEPLLKYVAHRSDLNYVIGEMIAELTVQHAYVDGGDFNIPPRPRVALPGARFGLDPEAGRFKIVKIFAGQNEEELYRSPLTEIGVDVKVGDYVLAINGEELKPTDDPYRLLRFKADAPVQLTVNSQPTLTGARVVSYRPITDEQPLIYLDWVAGNRARVDQLSEGRLGYLHVPDMGANGIREFIKWYYPQLRKEGLIIDVRANGGGNVSRMLIERLRRQVFAAQFGRTTEDPAIYPDGTFIGPMACLLNANSASDGDIFPSIFRAAGLGPLIGQRSWGGTVGITDHGALVDGGSVFVPEFGFSNTRGEWVIEGHGVDPDIEVDNDPKSVIQGRDPQLERGVTELMNKLRAKPVERPKRPEPPVKTK